MLDVAISVMNENGGSNVVAAVEDVVAVTADCAVVIVGVGVTYSSEDVLVMVSLVSVMNEIGKVEEDVKLVVDVPSVFEIVGDGVHDSCED
jgi:hypothetical protein